MISRCYNPKTERAYRYIGRGISVDKSWLSFDNFLADMGECPIGMSLGRIDNDGNYCKKNCRWETDYQQRNNTCRTHYIMMNGIKKSLQEWCDEIGINRGTVKQRIDRGWEEGRLLDRPRRNRPNAAMVNE